MPPESQAQDQLERASSATPSAGAVAVLHNSHTGNGEALDESNTAELSNAQNQEAPKASSKNGSPKTSPNSQHTSNDNANDAFKPESISEANDVQESGPAAPIAPSENKDGDETFKNTERDKELVEEFEYLLEKSQQLFLGISDLPEIGSKYWMPHFQRTFEVFTKLWKFQNHHRVLLEKPEHYGLKRWEVGEIASKIGQLYYRYYLRTSETNYLQESYVFYDAIRERNYFKGEQEVRNSALMIKKLRYYARFIVVCLQLGNTPMMLQLLDEVKSLIDVYSATFNPVDKMEWSLVVKEMALFMQAVCNPVPTDENGALLQTNYRLVSRRRPRLEKDGSKFRLQEAVIVGNRPTQIKFSELTLDMYHVLQMLEREPSALLKETNPSGATTTEAATITTPTAEASTTAVADAAKQSETKEKPAADQLENRDGASSMIGRPETASNDGSGKTDAAAEKDKEKEKGEGGERDNREAVEKDKDKDKVSRRVNPHKYVLYQPSFSHIQVYLASAFKEIGDQGCVLLYLSSDGSSVGNSPESGENNNAAATHGLIGGISTIRRNASDTGRDRSMEQLINTVHPADLVPYTRKPFFLVVESESSRAYKNMPNLFNQPLLCLLSPTSYPIPCSYGSIYTFFLHSPIVAFSAISQITKMEAHKWSELEALFNELEDLVFELLNICVTDHSTRRFLGDDFLRQIMIRHILCCAVLGHHRDFTWPEHWPQSSPETFSEVISAHALTHKVRYIIVFCSVEEFYRMDDGSPEPTTPQPSPPPDKISSPQQQQQQNLVASPPNAVTTADDDGSFATTSAPVSAPVSAPASALAPATAQPVATELEQHQQ
ncbi:hypothetical protein GGI25_001587 [Coemansia spiralis]|uniref:Protein SCAI n=2 Tax=Coemansia TaxID=4863 RepID=A0A9W8GAG9_9FUNG|nr:hypothetical protein EDC05_002089 [Coemansia umbellata]KAJ2679452.1 hypothetical protein GGI25_001587 [Coemansia spiralis]